MSTTSYNVAEKKIAKIEEILSSDPTLSDAIIGTIQSNIKITNPYLMAPWSPLADSNVKISNTPYVGLDATRYTWIGSIPINSQPGTLLEFRSFPAMDGVPPALSLLDQLDITNTNSKSWLINQTPI